MVRAHSIAFGFGLAVLACRICTTNFAAPVDRVKHFTVTDGLASAAAAAAGLQVGFDMDALPAEARFVTTVREDMPVVPVEALIVVVGIFWVGCLILASVADKQDSWQEMGVEKKFLRNIKGSYSLLAKRNDEGVKVSAGNLRWGVGGDIATAVNNNNRADVEGKGFWTSFLPALQKEQAEVGEITFCDTLSGKPLFVVPRGRTFAEFIEASKEQGKLAFRDAEVVTKNVRVVSEAEMVSVDGTHLGSNNPDTVGNCFHISLCAISGFPTSNDTANVEPARNVYGEPEGNLAPVPA